MSENLDYRQLIDDYLSGNITIKNKAVVEHKLATDPEFRNEFDLQRNVIDAIRATRKMELKGRLDNIQVHWYHSIPKAWKIAASVSVATLTTISAYFYFNPDIQFGDKLELEPDTSVEINLPEETVPQKPAVEIEKIPENTGETTGETVTETPEKPAEEAKISTHDNPVASVKKPEETTEAVTEEVTENEIAGSGEEFEVVVPDMDEEFMDAPDINMDELSGDNLNKLNPVREDMYSTTEVKTLRHKKYDFHYELREGILTLYGNFEDIPYEILEINSSDGKRLFLNYRNSYYMLLNTREISPLVPVTDSTLIKELEIVNNNK